MASKYPEEVRDFIYENYKKMSVAALTEAVNEKFGTSLTDGKIKAFKRNHRLKSGLDGRFRKGHVPANKGKKGCAPGSEKGWFKKGYMPHNWLPVGSEAVIQGYVKVKIAEPKKWKHKHILAYETAHGKIPCGHIVTFLDGNNRNFAIENLALISRGENAVLNRWRLRGTNREETKVLITLAKIKRAQSKRVKELKKTGEPKNSAKLDFCKKGALT